MKETSIEDESQEEARNDSNSNSNNKCEESKEQQNDISKKFVKPWGKLSFNKIPHGIGYDKETSFHIPINKFSL